MPVINVSESNFEEVTKSEGPVLLEFYADWCGPCRSMAPILEAVAEKMGDRVVVGKVDVDSNKELASKFSVSSIPTLFFLEDGEPVGGSHVGTMSTEELVENLQGFLGE